MQTKPIKYYVTALLDMVACMQRDYPKKKFTLDGRLVGDIGEILAEQIYDLELLEGQHPVHDAKSNDRLIQIKTTMKDKLNFGDVPDYYLGLKVDKDGNVEEIFNGPGSVIWDHIKHRKRPKNYMYSIGLSTLTRLNKQVPGSSKIAKKQKDKF